MKNKNVGQVLPDNKINCHAEKVLFSISALEKTQGRDPEQKRLRMTPYFNAPSTWRERAECVSTGVRGLFKEEALNKNDFRVSLRSGFTLIELLVVVIIVGILAAVVLPQYQLAVIKSRIATMLPILSTLRKAEAVYHLANGTYTMFIAELDVDIPCIEIYNTNDVPFRTCGNDFLVQVSDTGSYASYCPNHNNSTAECASNRDFQIAYNYTGTHYCLVKNGSTLGTTVCRSIGKEDENGLYKMK